MGHPGFGVQRIEKRRSLEWAQMRVAAAFAVMLCWGAMAFRAQTTGQASGAGQQGAQSSPAGALEQESNPTTLTVRSTLVEVPVLVKTKGGQVVFELTADDFVVTDDGVPQQVRIEEDTDGRPLALAVVVETGGAGTRHLADYAALDAVLDALIGNVEHRVALISFDSRPRLRMAFTENTADVSEQLSRLNGGDEGAAVLDGVAKAVEELKAQPPRFRRAILLLSETRDQSSTTTLSQALKSISDANITMYSFGFSSTGAAVGHEASKFNQRQPGPAHGCFSKDGADAEYVGQYSKQVLDCISQLAPPLRLATMAWIAASDGLKKNTAESIAGLTGGEFFHFKDAKDLRAGLIRASNDVPNYYVLSFRPSSVTAGLHALKVELKERPGLVMRARTEYWIDEAER
jgi:VWFA-related protein